MNKKILWIFIVVAFVIAIALFFPSYTITTIAILISIPTTALFSWIISEIKEKKLKNIIKEKDSAIQKLEEEKKELKSRQIDILEIKNIFRVAFMEVDAVDVRTFERTIDSKRKFIGALRINIKAQYGIDVEELKFRYQNDVLYVANLNPKFQAFPSRTSHWDYKITLEKFEPKILKKFRESYWRTYDANNAITMKMSDEILNDVENQLNTQGPKNADWITKPLEFKAITCLQLLFKIKNIQLEKNYDESYLSLADFLKLYGTQGTENKVPIDKL